ncbi:hypothetical protein [Streptomyces mangrovisoli]|uniref:Secreted protein n=1 Tax=Streptomyces mangrovisoli TaxID=1428628 RepID=A0A1J4NJL1_9ACTN|nr:hypothetical protein [Streptomyces mangrovisoli]OIJ62569.1 hypothetical protein WN71_038780 [Streptomyces mangrovisoli]
MKRSIRTALSAIGALIVSLGLPAGTAHADDVAPRIDLRVLVVSDGGPATQAIAAELQSDGTPFTEVDLTQSGRPTIDAAFLSDTVDGRPRARFQAVVLPNDNPFASGSAEMTALATYEQTYSIPQVDAYTYARPEAGLSYPTSGYSGSLDGVTASVTAAGKSGPFGYLDGNVPFEDNSTSVAESYGYLSTPAAGADFTTYVDAPIPGGSGRGSLVGEYKHDGRRELVVTFVYNQYQEQFRLLSRGIVEWMTGGVHLGASRNYFAVHVDDVFLSDDRWNSQLNCTPGDIDCTTSGGTESTVRMTADDADYAVAWEQRQNFTLDLAFNGGGSVDEREDNDGTDQLADKLIADKNQFRWINHTYTHPFLGCVQNTTVVPWVCQTTASGATQWVSQSDINGEIANNKAWAQTNGLTLDSSELVTGEHSGLKVLPQQTVDNPNLAPALAANGVTWLASDNSRESTQRSAGSALTVPRYPMNVYYNAGRQADEVDEYNWIYTSRAQGGSGLCEDNPATTTCLSAPLSTSTGYSDYIVPLETRIDLGHVLSNDPRPHYIHQSNLAEDRIAYPVLDGVLDGYAALFADDTPVVNLRMKDIGVELQRRAAWQSAVAAGQVTAYRIGDTVTVQAPSGLAVTATAPSGTTQGTGSFGSAYAGAVSGWTTPSAGTLTLALPSSTASVTAVQPASTAAAKAAARKTAPRTRVPAGTTRKVAYSPHR